MVTMFSEESKAAVEVEGRTPAVLLEEDGTGFVKRKFKVSRNPQRDTMAERLSHCLPPLKVGKTTKKSPFHRNEDRLEVVKDVRSAIHHAPLPSPLAVFCRCCCIAASLLPSLGPHPSPVVADGHGGDRCSQFVSKSFVQEMVNSSSELLPFLVMEDDLRVVAAQLLLQQEGNDVAVQESKTISATSKASQTQKKGKSHGATALKHPIEGGFGAPSPWMAWLQQRVSNNCMFIEEVLQRVLESSFHQVTILDATLQR